MLKKKWHLVSFILPNGNINGLNTELNMKVICPSDPNGALYVQEIKVSQVK